MMTLTRPGDTVDTDTHDERQATTPTSIVAREGSELASALRASGWVARAGWRSTDERGTSVWHVRFQPPPDGDMS